MCATGWGLTRYCVIHEERVLDVPLRRPGIHQSPGPERLTLQPTANKERRTVTGPPCYRLMSLLEDRIDSRVVIPGGERKPQLARLDAKLGR